MFKSGGSHVVLGIDIGKYRVAILSCKSRLEDNCKGNLYTTEFWGVEVFELDNKKRKNIDSYQKTCTVKQEGLESLLPQLTSDEFALLIHDLVEEQKNV